MLSSDPAPNDSTARDTGPLGGPADAPAPQFSELIDRWLQEGDRLDREAAPDGVPPALPATRWRRWVQRAREIAVPIVERHRLEVLVAAGLLPLMLALLAQGGAHHPAAPRAAPVPVSVASLTATPIATAAPPLSPRVLRPAPQVVAPAPVHHPIAHRHKAVVRRAAHAVPPPKGAHHPPAAPPRRR